MDDCDCSGDKIPTKRQLKFFAVYFGKGHIYYLVNFNPPTMLCDPVSRTPRRQ